MIYIHFKLNQKMLKMSTVSKMKDIFPIRYAVKEDRCDTAGLSKNRTNGSNFAAWTVYK